MVPQPPARKGVDPPSPASWLVPEGAVTGRGRGGRGALPLSPPEIWGGPPSPPPRPGNGRHQAQPGHRARVVTFRQRQPFPWGEPGRAGPAASPGPCGGRPGPRAPGGRDGGGGRRDGAIWFSHPWLPLGCFPGSCHGRPRGDKGPRAARALVGGQRRAGRAAAPGLLLGLWPRARGPGLWGQRLIGRYGGSFLSAPLCFALWF